MKYSIQSRLSVVFDVFISDDQGYMSRLGWMHF